MMTSAATTDHEHSAAVDEAAKWLATRGSLARHRSIVAEVRHQFGLSSLQAVEAIREANRIKQGGAYAS